MLKKLVKNILIILFTVFLIVPLILMVLDYYMKPKYYEGFDQITKPSYSFEFRNDVSNASVMDSISGEVAVTLSGGAYYDLSGMNLDGSGALASLDSFEMGGSDMTFEVYMQYNSDQNSFARIFDIGDYASNDQCIRMGIYDDYNKTLFGIFKKNGTIQEIYPNTLLSDEQWTNWNHYIGICSSTGMKLYLNGSQRALNVDATTLPTKTSRLYQTIGNSKDGSEGLNGTIAYFRIWDGVALDESDISYLYSERDTRNLSFETPSDSSTTDSSTTDSSTTDSSTTDSSSSGSSSSGSSSTGSSSTGSSSTDSSSTGNDNSGNNPFIELLSSDELQSFLSGVLSQYSSDSQTISGDNVQNYSWSQPNIKCVADNGQEPGNPLCCGQEGVLQDTKHICPSEYPFCEGYVCGETWGKCKTTRSTSGTTPGITYGQWVGST